MQGPMGEPNYTKIKVLIVEDDPDLADLMRRYLHAAGMDVRLAGSSREMAVALRAGPTDVVILDVNLPDEDGFSIASRLRDEPAMRLIILTARTQPDDRIMGRLVGADSYLTKPVQFRELEAVIRNLIRRTRTAASDQAGASDWELDGNQCSLRTPMGKTVPLTAGELTLLTCLLNQPGTTISRREIIVAFGHNPDTYDDRALSTIVTRLRRKVERTTEERMPIKAVRSVGYVFSPLPL